MEKAVRKTEWLLELGGTRKDVALLVLSGSALLLSMTNALPLPFDPAWAAILLCGIPILAEALIGLVTAFDIKADVLVSLALVASVLIGEYFAAGEVAFIMQIGGLLEELTVAKARTGSSPAGRTRSCTAARHPWKAVRNIRWEKRSPAVTRQGEDRRCTRSRIFG